MDTIRPASKAVVIGSVLGALFTPPTILLALMSSGAGYGDYFWARALFPSSMLLTLFEGSIGAISIGIALLQFPIYGGLLGWGVVRRNSLPAVAVASLHLGAAIACFSGILPNFS